MCYLHSIHLFYHRQMVNSACNLCRLNLMAQHTALPRGSVELTRPGWMDRLHGICTLAGYRFVFV